MIEQVRPTRYCDIDDPFTKKHIRTLITWLYEEVCSAGGDGDAIWYSNFYWVDELYELIKQFNDALPYKWDITLDTESKTIHWHSGQSGILITNNKEDFDNRPSWQQCSIVL